MTFYGGASVPAFAQAIRVAEPWTTQSRLMAVGLLLIAAVGVWALLRVRRGR